MHTWTGPAQAPVCAGVGLTPARAVRAAVLCQMLLLGGRSPNKVLYSRASGRVWQTDLVPTYDSTDVALERNEPVPFRLTRNLVAFFSLFGVDGVFVTSMVSAAQVGAPRAPATPGPDPHVGTRRARDVRRVCGACTADACARCARRRCWRRAATCWTC